MSGYRIAEISCDVCATREQPEDGDDIRDLRNFLREERGWTYKRWTVGTGHVMADLCDDCSESTTDDEIEAFAAALSDSGER